MSLLAGFATTLYAAYHFHRLAPYGVIANLLAMPVVSLWTMPMGILGVIAMPFGFDGFCWRLMGEGIDWMIAVAIWVASLPGAVGRMPAFGVGPLLLGSAGLVVLCLLKSPLRLAGVVLLAVASVWAARTPQPDVLIAADGTTFAVRGADGRLAIVRSGSDTFAARQWLAADADARAHTDPDLGGGDPLRSGRLRRPPCGRPPDRAGAHDRGVRGGLPPRRGGCESARGAAHCAALVIDRNVLHGPARWRCAAAAMASR